MENLKDALKTVIAVTEKTDSALEDGKVSIAEGVSIAMSAIGLIKVAKNIKPIWGEYKSLDSEQRGVLIDWFKEEFDLRDDNAEAMIENIFGTLVNLGELFESVSK